MRSGLRAAFLAVAIILPACGQYAGNIDPPRTVANAVLRGSQVIPALGAGPAGTATVTVSFNQTHIDYTVAATGLSGAATAIEIRFGGPRTLGPGLFTLPLAAFPLNGRLTDPGFFTSPVVTSEGTISTFASACDAISTGSAYLLISTAAQPAGEIRGHLGKAN